MLLSGISLFSGMSGASENSHGDFGRRPFSLPKRSVIDRVLSEGSVRSLSIYPREFMIDYSTYYLGSQGDQ